MVCDHCEFAVVEYSQAFPKAEFEPCLVLVLWTGTEGDKPRVEVYLSSRWHDLIRSEHKEYMQSLVEDWTAMGSGRDEIKQVLAQLQHLVVGPIRMSEFGQTDRSGLKAVLERILGISAAT
jgi:hypothetical protein